MNPNHSDRLNSLEINFKLDQKNRELLSVVSHDIKSPLNGILGFARILSDEIANENLKKMAQLIERAGQDILYLVNDVLSMAKIAAGREQSNFISIPDINIEFREIVEKFSIEASAKNISIELICEQFLIEANWDMENLRLHVFNNLISNSLKFTPAGGIIRITIAKQDKLAQITIEDSGPGILYEQLDRIFRAYSQIGQAPGLNNKGYGLGLYNAQRFIQSHNGTIRLDTSNLRDKSGTINLNKHSHSQDLSGARFIIEIPLIPEESSKIMPSIDAEYDQAIKIQRSMLPDHLELPGFDIAAESVPSGLIGGNWYDVQHITERYAMVSVGDISGKGLGASLNMSSVISLLRGITLSLTNPGKKHLPVTHGVDEILRLTNNVLIHQPFTSFATVFIGVIDLFKHTITYVRSGHEPALLIREQKIKPLCSSGGPLGVYKEKAFLQLMRKNTIELLSGDRILMLSDGLSEAFKPLDAFNENWLKTLLETTNPQKDTQSLVHEIVNKLPLYSEGVTDDIAVLSLRVL